MEYVWMWAAGLSMAIWASEILPQIRRARRKTPRWGGTGRKAKTHIVIDGEKA